MIHFWPVLLFCLSANLDTLVAAIALGCRHIAVPFRTGGIISLVTTLGTLLSMGIGRLVAGIMPPAFANRIGGAALILMGIWFLLSDLKKQWEEQIGRVSPDLSDRAGLPADSSLTVKSALPLAAALTVNNFGMGIAASITDIPIACTCLATFFFTLLFLAAGAALSRVPLLRRSGHAASLCSALLLIFLGGYEAFF